MSATKPFGLRTGDLTKPHTSVLSCGMPPGHHNGVTPGGGEPGVTERFSQGSVVLLLSSHSSPPTGTIKATGHGINIFFTHGGTDQKTICAMLRFWATASWQSKDIIVKDDVPSRGMRRKRA